MAYLSNHIRGMFLALLGLLILPACESENADPLSKTGHFLDSAVAGMTYVTYYENTITGFGKTDAAGRFSYKEGETVIFSVGKIEFPEVEADTVVTPLDMGSGELNDATVVNVTRLLQTLDVDSDPSNGIAIVEEAAVEATENINFDTDTISFESDTDELLENLEIEALVDTTDAIDHLEVTLEIVELVVDDEAEFIPAQSGQFSLTVITEQYGNKVEVELGQSPVPTLEEFETMVRGVYGYDVEVTNVSKSFDSSETKRFDATVLISVQGFQVVTIVSYRYDLVQ